MISTGETFKLYERKKICTIVINYCQLMSIKPSFSPQVIRLITLGKLSYLIWTVFPSGSPYKYNIQLTLALRAGLTGYCAVAGFSSEINSLLFISYIMEIELDIVVYTLYTLHSTPLSTSACVYCRGAGI